MNSRDYWEKRENEQLKHNLKTEIEYEKEIKRIYENMLDSIQTQIDAFYSRYASKEGITIADAKKGVSQLDIERYERKAKRYVKNKDFSKRANEEMRLYNLTMKINRLEMLKANIGLEMIASHDELDKFMKEILQGRTMEELERQAGILGKTVQNNAKMAHSIVNASFHNATFSDRIWANQTLLRADIDKLLQSGLIQGKNPRVLARDLRKVIDTSVYNSERLMRTELARVQTDAQLKEYEKYNVEEYEFICNHNGNTCEICQGLHKKRFKVADMMPGENAPPMHPLCRCSTVPYVDREELNRKIEFFAKGGTLEEWNKLNG